LAASLCSSGASMGASWSAYRRAMGSAGDISGIGDFHRIQRMDHP
jgi:hypothetical protein